jgi:hypothetical protein
LSLLLGLAPFAAFFAAARFISPMAGLLAALTVSALLCFRMYRRGKSIKILEIGSLLLFASLVLYTWVAAPVWTVATVRLAVDGGLLAIVLASLAINNPFTMQYAREQVPREYWNSPQFLAANWVISAAWAGAFAVLLAADAAAEYVSSIPLWIDIAASIAAFLAAVGFTIWYPGVVRARAQSTAARSAQSRS